MKKLFITAVTLLGVSSLFGQEGGWNFDKSHSSIGFTVVHMVVSEVYGRFGDFTVAFTSSRDDFSDASVEVVIKANSINTDNTSRDNDLKSDNFFSADKYPEIRFKSDSFEKVDSNKYKILGDLTMRDVTKKVIFDAEYRGSVKTQRGTVIAWKATTAINRFDYGLKWDRMIEAGYVVGETVTIQISLEFRK
jgi:polyisoprenoid-binding protein YceI